MSSGIFGPEATIRRPQGDHEATLARQGGQRRERIGSAGIVSIRTDGERAHDNAIESAGHIWVPACAGMTEGSAAFHRQG